jgi:hypothetical protein
LAWVTDRFPPDQMLEFAHSLDRLLHIAEPYLIGVAVILWAVAFGAAAVGFWQQPWRTPRRPSPLFIWPGIGFLAIILSIVGGAVFLGHAARNEVRPRLNAAVTGIRVNGRPTPDPERLLTALRQIQPHDYHHSHPTTAYRVQLQTAEGPLELVLQRDSAVPNEYWVFYPSFDEANDIGTVMTDALDGL